MKLLKVLILILLCLSIFISCGNNEKSNEIKNNNIETEPMETTTGRIEPDLPAMNFNGQVYRILGRDHQTYKQFVNFEIYAESITGEIVNDAIFERNSRLEEKYNCVIEGDLRENPHDLLAKSIAAGEDLYSLAFIDVTNGSLGPSSQKGYFYDLNSLKHLDFSKPWWSQEVSKTLSIEGRLYFTTGDFNMMDKNRTYILVYNKDLAESFGLGTFYQYVYDNTWTLDKMAEYCLVVSDDIDGDGVMTDADRWGLGMDSRYAFFTFITAADNMIVTKAAGDIPTITISNDHTITSIDKVLKLTNNKNTSYYCEEFQGKVSYDHWYTASTMFNAERLLFIASFTQGLKTYSAEADFNYGIMPYPKLDEKQEKYYANAYNWGSMLVIPSSVNDTDFASFMLEAICAASRYEVLPRYYEDSSKTKYMYDEQSPIMFDLIFSGLRYDLGVIFDWGGLRVLFVSTIPTDGTNTFVSKYAALEEKAFTQLESSLEAFRELP
ncbi:MAG: hypothetical protein FWF15_03440 [Oscillospiraceae bacterium]|nr:hypothetical protein [Oscillospiraceae bacterium]